MVSTYDHGKAISVYLSELYRFSFCCVIRHNNVSPTTVNTIHWHFHLPINACTMTYNWDFWLQIPHTFIAPKSHYRCKISPATYVGWGCIPNCYMLSSLPCFYALCWSAIPTSCYILNVLILVEVVTESVQLLHYNNYVLYNFVAGSYYCFTMKNGGKGACFCNTKLTSRVGNWVKPDKSHQSLNAYTHTHG